MTAAALLAWISAALGLQLAVAIAVAFWRRTHTASADPVAPEARRLAPGGWSGWRDFRVVRRVYEDRAQTLCSFHLEPVDGGALPSFAPGQFLTLALEVDAGRTLTRCYSLSDAANGRSFRISVKRAPAPEGRPAVPAGVCSGFLHDRVQVGDVVRARAPAGRFVIEPEPGVPVVLIAGGIGITPLLCMLRGGVAVQPGSRVHLYYGVRNGAVLGFADELADLTRNHPNLRLNVLYSAPEAGEEVGDNVHTIGEVDVDLLRRTLPAGRHRFYLCGPPVMLAKLTAALREWGVQPEDVRQEGFGPGSVPEVAEVLPVTGAGPQFEVRFQRTGRTLVWDGRDGNLLALAERHGVPAASGCRTGMCGLCEVQLASGKVRYAQAPDFEPTQGHCLLCVGVPVSDVELVA